MTIEIRLKSKHVNGLKKKRIPPREWGSWSKALRFHITQTKILCKNVMIKTHNFNITNDNRLLFSCVSFLFHAHFVEIDSNLAMKYINLWDLKQKTSSFQRQNKMRRFNRIFNSLGIESLSFFSLILNGLRR